MKLEPSCRTVASPLGAQARVLKLSGGSGRAQTPPTMPRHLGQLAEEVLWLAFPTSLELLLAVGGASGKE